MIAGRKVAVYSLVRRREEQPRYRLLRTLSARRQVMSNYLDCLRCSRKLRMQCRAIHKEMQIVVGAVTSVSPPLISIPNLLVP